MPIYICIDVIKTAWYLVQRHDNINAVKGKIVSGLDTSFVNLPSSTYLIIYFLFKPEINVTLRHSFWYSREWFKPLSDFSFGLLRRIFCPKKHNSKWKEIHIRDSGNSHLRWLFLYVPITRSPFIRCIEYDCKMLSLPLTCHCDNGHQKHANMMQFLSKSTNC